MTLFVHIIFGAIWGVAAPNFLAALSLGFITHYLLDSIPHWEYKVDGLKNGRAWEALRDLIKVALDIAAGVILIFYLTKNSPLQPFVFWGALGGLLPDGLVFLAWQSAKNKKTREARNN